jgi:SAM-dependent methyltransferase
MILLLSGVPSVQHDDLLIVGPRFEEEIFYARGLGWRVDGVRALDLLSYSRLIDQGDMHALPYGDEKFDAVCCGWTLSYSREPQLAASEMSRVLKPGGVLALGVEVAESAGPTRIRGILKGRDRIQTTQQIVDIFPQLRLVASFVPPQLGDAVWILKEP